VYHNTILKTGAEGHNNRGIRVVASTPCKNIEISNNLFNGGLETGPAVLSNNVNQKLDGFFIEAGRANLRLVPSAAAIGKCAALKDAAEDYDGAVRDGAPDAGAFEFGATKPAVLADAGKKVAGSASASGAPSAILSVPAVAVAPVKAIDPAPHRKALEGVLQGDQAARNVNICVKIFGRPETVVFKKADGASVEVVVQGNALPLRWKDISDEDLIQAIFATSGANTDAVFHAGALAAAGNMDALREKALNRLVELNPERARGLDALIAGR